MTHDDRQPNWLPMREKLRRALTQAGATAQREALAAIIDAIVQQFESSAPTAWEAHFLMHAIWHLDEGYVAVAAEEISSVLKPRSEQAADGFAPPRTFAAAGRRSQGAWVAA
ncbi:MAG: hypothetical protein F8N37_05405 [Telmatospirillum sp.]|nr:hypothetical protein [Telmatospirillum sp.]